MSKTILAVLGSTRPGSASLKAAERVLDGAREAGYEIREYRINEIFFRGCIGCGQCRKSDVDCVQQDDLAPYFAALHEADALLITAPNYYSKVSGQMIAFLNRHYCMIRSDHSNRLPAGKKLIGIFSQGAPAGYPKYQEHYKWYLSCFTSKGFELAGWLNIGGDSDLSENGDVLQKAYALGKSL